MVNYEGFIGRCAAPKMTLPRGQHTMSALVANEWPGNTHELRNSSQAGNTTIDARARIKALKIRKKQFKFSWPGRPPKDE
jgi:DNA-binding NtrC family response regulator